MSPLTTPYFIFIFILYVSIVTGQTCQSPLHNHALPLEVSINENQINSYTEEIGAYLEKDISNLNKQHNKDLKKYYTNRVRRLTYMAEEGHFYYEEKLKKQIEELGAKLIAANDIKNKNRINWVIHRTGNPNAACFGEGTLMLNLGLLSKMENLNQIAFIMAHELAHHHMNHVNKKMKKAVDFMNSDELKKKVKSASKDEAEAREELLNLLDENSLNQSKHSRANEIETDKIGYAFYIQAGFPAEQATEAMKILKHIDHGKYPTPNLAKIFFSPEIEWNPKWTITKLSGLSLIKPSEAEIEKYRTHPDTDLRIEQLLALGSKESEENTDAEWCKQTVGFDLEILKHSYEITDKFNALILSFQLYELNENNVFVKSLLGNVLCDIIVAKKNHKASSFIPNPNTKMKDHVFEVATFLDNIPFSKLSKLVNVWINENIDFSHDNHEAIEALQIKLKYINGESIDSVKSTFDSKYPNSPFF